MRIQHGPAAKIEEKETKETSISGIKKAQSEGKSQPEVRVRQRRYLACFV
jgi:hypothetical protein